MTDTVFYAWQNDLPSNTNRAFIRHAIDRAISNVNATLGVEEAVRADQDTQGIAGDIHVAEVIFEKIKSARIFVADITTITPQGAARPAPNPNVLIEYGRASVRPGSSFVITVFNEAFGSWETERPFDMRHRRKPVTYRLAESHTSEERTAALDRLARSLADIFLETLALPRHTASLPDASQFDPIRILYKATLPRERQTGRIIGFWCGALPYGQTLNLPRPWETESLVHRRRSFPVRLGNTPLKFEVIEGADYDGPFRFSPIQNGARGRWDRVFHSQLRERDMYVEDLTSIVVYEDGRIAVIGRSTELAPEPHLNVRWIMAGVMNTLLVIHRVRQATQRRAASYALFLELRYDEQESPEIINPVPDGRWRLCDIADEQGRIGPIVTSAPKKYGPIHVGASATFPALLSQIYELIQTSAERIPNRELKFDSSLDPLE